MKTLTYSFLFEVLGFIGLASVGIIPYRSWSILKTILIVDAQHPRSGIEATTLTIIIVAAIYTDIRISLITFKCLTQTYCGPNIATGWIYLAALGITYLIFEAIIFITKRPIKK